MTLTDPRESASAIKTALYSGSFLALSKIYYLIVRSAYIIFFAGIIGLEQYGYYSYTQNWYVLFLPMAMWGMNELVISEYVKTGPALRDDLIGTGLSLRLLLCMLFCLGVMGVAAVTEQNPDLRLLIFIYSQAILARGGANWICALFVANNKSQYWLYVSVPFMTLEILLVLILAYNGEPLATIAWMQCALWWCMFAVAYIVYRTLLQAVRLRWSSRFLGFYFKSGFPVGAATFLMFCLTPGLLILFRHLAEDLNKIGVVALVLQVMMILDQVILVVGNAALPALNRVTSEIGSRFSQFTLFTWKFAFYIGGIVWLSCWWLVPATLHRLPDTRFDEAAALFAEYSWIVIPLLALHGFRLVLISSGRLKQLLFTMVCGLAVQLMLVLVLAHFDHLNAQALFAVMGVTLISIALLLLSNIIVGTESFSGLPLLVPPVVLGGAATAFYLLVDYYGILAGVVSIGTLLVAAVRSREAQMLITYHAAQKHQ